MQVARPGGTLLPGDVLRVVENLHEVRSSFCYGTQELLLFKKLFLLLQKNGFDTLFQQKAELFGVIT